VAAPSRARRGVRALHRLLQDRTFDLRALDLPGFRRWLDVHLAHWRKNSVFAQRVRIRDLRRTHPELHRLEQELRRAADADARTPQCGPLHEAEREMGNAARAISGLTAALKRAAPAERPALRQKMTAFQARRQALQDEQARLIASSPERQDWLRLDARLRALRAALGLDEEEARLEALFKAQGHRSGHAGTSFEETALALTQGCVIPELLRGGPEPGGGAVRLLRGVTLGAARTELDQLVVRQPAGGGPVEVLAVVEAKRNLNDLAHGFRLRQENLAWLTGDEGAYDQEAYRTKYFRSGHFDRAAVHEEGGEAFAFARGSFRGFRRDPAAGVFLDRLYFITRAGTMWGVSMAALGRINFRVATDERWDPDSAAYLDGLLRWCRSLAEPVETPDVLRLYAAETERARRILLVGR
jgi:hypothetical protein